MGDSGINRSDREFSIDRIEAYLRQYTPVSKPQNDVIARLRTLDDEGVIGSYDVDYVPKAISREGELSDVERLYERFVDWSNRTGYDVGRPFHVRSWENEFTGETTHKLLTPIVSLAVYDDRDEIAAVLPCDDPQTEAHVSVLDYLDALLRDEDPLGTIATSPVDGDDAVVEVVK